MIFSRATVTVPEYELAWSVIANETEARTNGECPRPMFSFHASSVKCPSSTRRGAIACSSSSLNSPRHRIIQRGKARFVLRCSPPRFNPQNVDAAKVRPATGLSAEEAVSLQVEALQSTHEPWTNHGIQVMYDFCEGAGGMERSRYFGYSKGV